MKKMLTSLIVFLGLTSAHAQTAPSKPVKLGVLNDQSGQYADAAGPASVEVARMAVADFGGKLLGQPIELIFADHQNKADIASGIARRWIDTENVDVILDIGNSAVALALSDIVRDKSKIMIVSSAGASTITNEKCSPNTFQWTYNTATLARSTAKALLGQGGNEWFFLTADYAFGHAFEADASAVVKASGGKIVGSVRHPFNTSDFSSFLLQAQSSGANVLALANASGDTSNSLMQAHEFGLLGQKSKMKVAALLFQITDAKSVGLKNLQGLFTSEAFYWDRNDASRAFGKRFFDKVGRMPTMVQAGMYSATLALSEGRGGCRYTRYRRRCSQNSVRCRSMTSSRRRAMSAKTACTSTITTCCGQRPWSNPKGRGIFMTSSQPFRPTTPTFRATRANVR